MDGARYHNAWARKTYSGRVLLVTIGLGELMWSEEQAMSVSGHRSAEQMRRDYDYVIETTSHLKWSKNPPRTRALCSRNLAQYPMNREIVQVRFVLQPD